MRDLAELILRAAPIGLAVALTFGWWVERRARIREQDKALHFLLETNNKLVRRVDELETRLDRAGIALPSPREERLKKILMPPPAPTPAEVLLAPELQESRTAPAVGGPTLPVPGPTKLD